MVFKSVYIKLTGFSRVFQYLTAKNETDNLLVCNKDTEWSCPGVHQCIPIEWRCNRNKDCMNGADEENCAGRLLHLFSLTHQCDQVVVIFRSLKKRKPLVLAADLFEILFMTSLQFICHMAWRLTLRFPPFESRAKPKISYACKG